MHAAVDEMGKRETFHGYGPEQGYDFLVEAIREHDYASRGVDIAADEIFVSDGSKCDSGNIQEIFALAARDRGHRSGLSGLRRLERDGGPHPAAGADGRYPGLTYLVGNEANGFQPEPPTEAGRRRLPVLAEQPDRHGRDARAARALGRVGAGERRGDPVRRRVRGVHLRSVAAALDLRDPGREGVRARAAQLLQARGLHRRALRVHGRAEDRDGRGSRAASASRSTRCGRAVTRRSSTARRTSCSAARRRRTRPRASRRRTRRSRSTWRTRGCSARASARPGSRSSAACTRRTSGSARRRRDVVGVLRSSCSSKAQVVGTPGAGFGPAGEGYFRLSAFNSRANIEEAIGAHPQVFG